MSLSGTALDKRLSQAKYLRTFLTCSLIGSLLLHLGGLAYGVINLLVKVPEVEEEPVEIVLLDEPIEEVQTPEPVKPKPEVKKIETLPEPKPEIKEIETPPEPKLETKLDIPDIPDPVTPLPKQFTQKFTLPEVDEPLQQKPLEPEPVKPVEPIQPKTTQVTPPEPIKPIQPEPVKPIEPIQPKKIQVTPPEPVKPIQPEPIQPSQPVEPIQTEPKDWGSLLSKKSDITTPNDFSIDTPISPVPDPAPIPNNNSSTRRRKIIGSSDNNIASNPNLGNIETGNIANNNSRRRKIIGGSNSNIASNPINPNPGIGESNGSGDGRAACRRCPERYPSWARSRGIEGTIVVMVNTDAAGNVTTVDIVSGSGSSRLDNYHKKQVRRWKLKSSSNGRNNVRIVTRYRLE